MRAIVYGRYGQPDELRVEDVPVPEPKADHVLVEVVATSVNLTDWEGLTGRPAYARIGSGLRRPGKRVLGSDIAGVVSAVGREVTEFAPGDAVFGDNLWIKGGFAEFAVIPEKALAPKPDTLSFAQASVIPQTGAIARHGTADVRAGDRVLINGGGGGSGSFAIPLAKRAGAHVTAVDNAGKLDFMRSLGADEVIDYREVDFTATGQRYDRILDLVASRSVFSYRRALSPGGVYQCVGGSVPTMLRLLTAGTIVGRLSGRRIGVLGVKDGPEGFGPVTELCASGDLDVHVDRTYALEDVPEALARIGEGLTLGKIVIEVRS
ncbi:MAG: NAD(P)-dependent alcohol dehydrogenase [Acidimicrobiales bacterium]|nr:NAD(P)-dependent alcohol dehydrogenase [Acidimicrobiales bacterium]